MKNETHTSSNDKNENFDISVLENRVFALEQFLGSSANTLDMDAASFQYQSPGSLGGKNDIFSSSGSVFPLVDSITRWYYYYLRFFFLLFWSVLDFFFHMNAFILSI